MIGWLGQNGNMDKCNWTFKIKLLISSGLILKLPKYCLHVSYIISRLRPKVLISPLLLVPWLQIKKTDHQKSWPSNVLLDKNFGLILKKQNGRHSQLFKNH